MVYYAVIDTNVFISALLSKRADAATVRVLDAVFDGKIVPLYHEDILAEYDEENDELVQDTSVAKEIDDQVEAILKDNEGIVIFA